ncbi:MAG: hypothetical protein II488_01325, partial [Firmicutes bacterium]|nr:hypothetical protein [Bacillota bacterium]
MKTAGLSPEALTETCRFRLGSAEITVEPPADFAEFWEGRKKEVAEHDLQPKLVELNSKDS